MTESAFDRWLTTEPREQEDVPEIPTTPLVWVVEENPYTGTLSDYAKACERANLNGFEISNQVWSVSYETVDGYKLEPSQVAFAQGPWNPDGYASVVVYWRGEIATYTLDGRS